MVKAGIAVLVTLGTTLSGCQQDISEELRKQSAELEALKTKVSEMEIKLDEAVIDNTITKLFRDMDTKVVLMPGDEGYSVIAYNLGHFTIQIEDIRPFANGSKVTLKFGNLQSAEINGVEGHIEWGSTDKNGRPDLDNAASKDFKISKSLSPGSWNRTTITLDGTPPDKLGFVRVSNLSAPRISLFDRR